MKLFQLKVCGLCFGLMSQFSLQVAVANDAASIVKVEDGSAEVSNVSSALSLDNDVALTLLTQGIAHCTKATRSSRTNQLAAIKEYKLYAIALSRAKAIYPNISAHSRTLSRQMEQCAQIGTDIARIQALPLLEVGVLACKEAKVLAKGDYLSKARIKYKEYQDFRNQAVALTDSVLKVGSNSSKVRRCDMLESSLMAAQTRVVNDEQKAVELISLLRRAEDSCLVAQSMAIKSGESRVNLDTTKSMLGHAKSYFNETPLHKSALDRASNYPGYSSSKQIQQLISTFLICRDELMVVIGAATQSVIRQEELSKIREKQQIDVAVAKAVSEAKKEAFAAMAPSGSDADQQKTAVLEEDDGEDSVMPARLGKSSRARTDVVQVTKSW